MPFFLVSPVTDILTDSEMIIVLFYEFLSSQTQILLQGSYLVLYTRNYIYVGVVLLA